MPFCLVLRLIKAGADLHMLMRVAISVIYHSFAVSIHTDILHMITSHYVLSDIRETFQSDLGGQTLSGHLEHTLVRLISTSEPTRMTERTSLNSTSFTELGIPDTAP